MRFGIFYEHQLPRPWENGSEQQLFQDALAQVELADRLGIDYAWEVEHHFLEEYSHSSAPEVFLAAASQRTRQIRLGYGIVLMPPGYNHPARVAERLATLDLVSNGRVEWGTGESASRAELEGFGIDPAERRAMWRESTEQVASMLALDPYPGQFALGHHYVFGRHRPGRTDIWDKFVAVRAELDLAVLGGGTGCIGTPDELRATLRAFEDYGVDQTIFIQQSGKNQHEHICESLELFAAAVMPEFKAREAARAARKAEALAPYVAAAFERKRAAGNPVAADIPIYEAYGLTITQPIDLEKMPEANRRRILTFRRMREIMEGHSPA